MWLTERLQKSREYPCAQPTLRGLSADTDKTQRCQKQNTNRALPQVA